MEKGFLMLDGHAFPIDRERFEKTKAGELAEQLQDFLSTFPDRELQRKGAWFVKRLRSIQKAHD